MNVKDYIGETSSYDKKQAVEKRKVKSWLKSVSAFANGDGGTFIFGIADNDDLIGLEDCKSDSEFISQKIKERIDPVPQVQLRIEEIDSKFIILLTINKGNDTPYYYIGDGATEAYVRIGNESVIADATTHKRLVLRGKNLFFDSLPTDYLLSDYSFSKLRERYKVWTRKSFEDKLLFSFGLVTDDDHLTNAGALICDESPILQNRLFCTRWNGLTKANGLMDALDSNEYTGSLITLLNEGEAFIKRNCKIMWKKRPSDRLELPDYVQRSYLEALVNAIVHRDYMIYGSEIHIDIFDDRLEIYSPGSMPNGAHIQDMNIDYIPSDRRNPTICDVFARLGYMERQGSGLGKIVKNYEGEELYTNEKRPYFYSDAYQFRVILPNLNFNILNNGTQDGTQNGTQNGTQDKQNEHILELIKSNNKITAKEMSEILGISVRTLRRRIKDIDQVRYIGHGKSGHWEIEK